MQNNPPATIANLFHGGTLFQVCDDGRIEPLMEPDIVEELTDDEQVRGVVLTLRQD